MLFTPTIQSSGVKLKNCEKCRGKAKETKNKTCEHGKRKIQCIECVLNKIVMSQNYNMNSTKNNSFKIAVKKVFSDLLLEK